MAERDIYLSGQPDQSSEDFSLAVSIVDKIKDPRLRENTSLKVSKELARVGREPTASPSHFFEVVDQAESQTRNDLYEGISTLQAEMGDTPAALQTAELTYEHPWFYTGLARIVAGHGENSQPIFDRIHSKLRIDAGIGDVRWAGHTLEAQRELGLDTPKHLIERFRVGDDSSYNLELAEAYARAGYPSDGLDVWRLARDTGYHHKAEVLSMIAISQGRNGIDPREEVASAVKLAEALTLKGDDSYHPGWKQAEIYANFARAYALYDLDPQPFVDRALAKALEEPSNLRADAYTEIAKAQVSFHADAKPTLALALEWADNIVKPGEKDISGYGEVIQMINWEEIFHTQLDVGHFDDARAIIQRLDRYPDQDVIAHKAELFAELGRAQALRALPAA